MKYFRLNQLANIFFAFILFAGAALSMPAMTDMNSSAAGENFSALTENQRREIESVVRDSTSQIWFEKNIGQFPSDVLFGFRTSFGSMLVYENHLQILTYQTDEVSGQSGIHAVDVSFAGGNSAWDVEAGGRSEVTGSYQTFEGEVLHPEIFKEITLRNVYDGIDLRLYSAEKGILEFDWIIARAEDYQKIRMEFSGQDALSAGSDGSLTLNLRYQDLTLQMPETYQVVDGAKRQVSAKMVTSGDSNEVRYELGSEVVAGLPLVIDPSIAWSTYFELNDNALPFDSYVYSVAVNFNGVYVGGWVREMIVNGSYGNYMEVNAGFSQGTATFQNYIYRLNNAGTNITAWTSTGIANDNSGVNNQKIDDATNDAIADLELFPDGRVLAGFASGRIQIYAANLSSRAYNLEPVTMDTLNSVAIVDNNAFYTSGRVVAAISSGEISSANIGPDATFAGTYEGVIVRFSNASTTPAPSWASYVGGNGSEYFTTVSMTPDRSKVVFSTISAVNATPGYPALVNSVDATLSAAGTTESLIGVLADGETVPASFNVFSYLGGSGNEGTVGTNTTASVVTATNTHFYVAGSTASAGAGMPGITGGAQTVNGGGAFDVFISRIPINGGATGFQTTFLGGNTEDRIGGIAYDLASNQLLVFGTTTGNFPVLNSTPASDYYDGTAGGGLDIFVAIFSDALTSKVYATYIGGGQNDYLGQTGDLIGQGHVIYSADTGLTYLATTVHSNLPAAAIGNPPGKDRTKSNSETAVNDAHTVFAFNVNSFDYGDAPLSYDGGSVTTAANSAKSSTIRIGATVDAEGLPENGSTALGDDAADTGSSDDEDGVSTLPSLLAGDTSYSATVSVLNNSGSSRTLQGWVDLNLDGSFQVSEFASVSVPSSAAQQNVTLNWGSFAAVSAGQRYLRLRLNDGSLTDNASTTAVDERSIGRAGSGEVEDYALLQVARLSKVFSPATIVAGGISTLSFTIDPNGVSQNNVMFMDNFPSSMVVAEPTGASTSGCGSPTFSPTAGAASVSFSGGTIAAGVPCTVTVNVTVPNPGNYTNLDLVVGSDNGAGTTTGAALDVDFAAPPSITKSFFPDLILEGGTSILTFVITNPESTAAQTGVSFTDSLPASAGNQMTISNPSGAASTCGGTLTATAGTSFIQLTDGTIPASGTCTIQVNVTAPVAGTYTNITSNVSSTNGGTGGNSGNVPLTAVAAPNGCIPGQIIAQWNFDASLTAATVNNSTGTPGIVENGISAASSVQGNPGSGLSRSHTQWNTAALNTATDYLQFDVNTQGYRNIVFAYDVRRSANGPDDVVAAYDFDGAGVPTTVTADNLAANGVWYTFSKDLSAVAALNDLAGSRFLLYGYNAATSTGTLRVDNATVTGCRIINPPSMVKSFSPSLIPTGGTSTLTFTLTNSNTYTALNGIEFNDTYPTNLVNAAVPAVTNSCGGTVTAAAGGGGISLVGGTLPIGGSCSITVAVTSSTAGTHLNTSGAVSSTNGGIGNAPSASLSVQEMNFGHLPSAFTGMNLFANGGAYHLTDTESDSSPATATLLGTSVTTAADGIDTVTYTTKVSDNGVTWTPNVAWVPGGTGSLDITATCSAQPCYLHAWFDWNRDNDFNDAGEVITFLNAPGGNQLSDTTAPITNTFTTTLTFNIPASAVFDGSNIYSRFRLYSAQPASPSAGGPALDGSGNLLAGEVEDPFFQIKSNGVVTPITLSYFHAQLAGQPARTGSSITFNWSTATETGNAGFNLYVLTDGNLKRINYELIPSRVVDSLDRQDYSYKAVVKGNLFYIEDVSILGETKQHGPFKINEKYGVRLESIKIDQTAVQTEHEEKYSEHQDELIQALTVPQVEIGAVIPVPETFALPLAAAAPCGRGNHPCHVTPTPTSLVKATPTSCVRRNGRPCPPTPTAIATMTPTATFEPTATAVTATPEPTMTETAAPTATFTEIPVTATPAPDPVNQLSVTFNFKVRQTGLYRVTYEMLQTAGLDLAGVPAANVALVNSGRNVPISTNGQQEIFGPGNYIEFYGEALDTLYTDTNVYVLQVFNVPIGKIQNDVSLPGMDLLPPASYTETLEVNNQRVFSNTAPAGDVWYDTRMLTYKTSKSWNFNFQINGLTNVNAPASLELVVWGVTDWPQSPDHHMLVNLNGVPLSDQTFNGLVEHIIKVDLPAGTLKEGVNTLQLTLPGDTGVAYDLVNLDRFKVTYQRAFKAVDGRLTFTAAGSVFEVENLPTANVVVYRIDPMGFSRINALTVIPAGTSFTARFAGTNAEAKYLVSTVEALRTPALEAARLQAELDRRAEYLIISHPDFMPGLAPLVQARLAQGLTVSVVDVTDLYTQFSYGVFDPQAIKKYIAYAKQNLGTKYVLLVGGDTYDYRNYLGRNGISFIPSLYVSTGKIARFVPVDPLYADVNGDQVPDLAIGRFPVRTNAELTLMVNKTLAYDSKTYGHTAVFTSDKFDGVVSFKNISNSISASMPADWTMQGIHLDDFASAATAQEQLIAAMNNGTALVSFTGHSSASMWTYNGLFNTTNAAALTNAGKPFVVVQWGCWNTYYVDPANNYLVQSFLFSGDNGAAAVFGAATLTDSDSERLLGQLLMPRLASPGMPMGQALLDAKTELAKTHPELLDVLLGWSLMGDPALMIVP